MILITARRNNDPEYTLFLVNVNQISTIEPTRTGSKVLMNNSDNFFSNISFEEIMEKITAHTGLVIE